MSSSDKKKLTIGISSMALFDLVESNRIFETEGKEAYCAYQIAREEESLAPGVAYPLVKKLLGLNRRLPEALVEVILLSRNSADTGLRVFNSIREHDLDIKRAAFTSGYSPFSYISAFEADLFLSTSPEDVSRALEAGHAAATILSGKGNDADNDQLRIAFDGDAVIFSDESERIYKEKGLDAFTENEQLAAKEPMTGGPFKSFLSALHNLQSQFAEEVSPVRTALVTARSAPAHERVVRTLRTWGIRIDEALFLGGLPKGEFLKSFGADIFFDDQTVHCESAQEHVATGHVPHGVANES
ncbi:MAG: 5'-nucleotidase [Cycloclasticus sp.]|nr:5'-nucleotidase [Cycloclasticus sp.]MBG95518.1 5'-nucleotidase [Cycloclasticus sp.]|tara:strand:- start:249 stop:1148 length:900 start_codon:yes stop_codon:yes gene_type:complete